MRYFITGKKWFQKTYGNTYHTISIVDQNGLPLYESKNKVYGYGDHYKQTALEILLELGLIPEKYKDNLHLFERENNYPITWKVWDVTRKKDLF